MNNNNNKVKLRSADGDLIEVDEEVACKSVVIKNMVEDIGVEDEITIPNVKK